MVPLVVVFFLAITFQCSFIKGDISGTDPPTGSCLCLDFDTANVRDPACGTLVGITGTGYCYRYTGENEICSMSGQTDEFFQVNYNTGYGWISGKFLNVGTDERCNCQVTQISATDGDVTSPNYPGLYPNNFTCIHIMPLPKGNVLQITFNDPFGLEYGLDYLKFHITSEICQRHSELSYTGTSLPYPIALMACDVDDTVRMDFTTDPFVALAGFSFHYNNYVYGTTHTAATGTIMSPNYPNTYPAYADCLDTIEMPSNGTIRITFRRQFWLQDGLDTVTISTSASTCASDSQHVYTGNATPLILTLNSCSVATVRFQSSNSVEFTGFALDYEFF